MHRAGLPAARTEEAAGRIVAARKLIKAGCEKCPQSEDIWWTAAKLHVSNGKFGDIPSL